MRAQPDPGECRLMYMYVCVCNTAIRLKYCSSGVDYSRPQILSCAIAETVIALCCVDNCGLLTWFSLVIRYEKHRVHEHLSLLYCYCMVCIYMATIILRTHQCIQQTNVN